MFVIQLRTTFMVSSVKIQLAFSVEPSKLQLVMYFVLSPLFCYAVEAVSYVAFLGLFSYVILQEFCIRYTFWEYLLVIWMFAIQLERVRKFISIPRKTKTERFSMMIKDRINLMFLLSLVTFSAGLILRSASILNYEEIFKNNVKEFSNLGVSAYGTEDWEEFKEQRNFSMAGAMFSNDRNPIYTDLSDEARQFLAENHNIYPFNFIR